MGIVEEHPARTSQRPPEGASPIGYVFVPRVYGTALGVKPVQVIGLAGVLE
jgi:hypothetical protein